ncbi:MAG: hypothetical protein AAFU80_16965 [Pseudomonadota bacterium]
MTALWDSGRSGAATHVLIIGVGCYGAREANSEAMAFREYSAIPRSARRILDWVFEDGARFDPPLGAVFAALADPEFGPVPVPVDTPDGPVEAPFPTLANLRKVVTAWFRRLDEDPGATAFAYLCGHGIARNSSYLLSADWGTQEYDPYFGLIDIDGFEMVVRCRKAGRQFIIADCCQEHPPELFDALLNPNAEDFGSAGRKTLLRPQRALVKSAQPGGQALARATGVTHFCDAFLEAVKGEGARGAEDGSWVVSIPSLKDAIPRIAARRAKVLLEPLWLTSYGDAPVLARLPDAPVVDVRFRTDPDAAIYYGELEVNHVDDGPAGHVSYPAEAEVVLPLKAQGGYIANARFEAGDYADRMWPFAARPLDNPVILKTPPSEGG